MVDYGGLVPHGNPAAAPHACTSLFDSAPGKEDWRRRTAVLYFQSQSYLQKLPTPTLDQGITLKGVFVNEGFAKAFLLTTQNPVGVWVQVNEEINGWRVAVVSPDQVVLEGQNQKLVVPLNVSGR